MPNEVVYKPVEKIKPIYTGGTLTPPKFMPTYYEWLSKRGKRILKNSSVVWSTATIYTVPEHTTLFITSVNLVHKTTADSVNEIVRLLIDDQRVLNQPITGGANVQGSIVANFSIPIEVTAGQKINIYSGGEFLQCTGSIVGFEVKNQDIPIF